MKTITDRHREVFERWFKDPDTVVCCFEHKELGSRDLGQRISLSFTKADAAKMKLGDRAPDTKTLIGWRYQLVAKADTVEQALANEGLGDVAS